MYYKLRCNSTQFVIYYKLRNYYKLQRNSAVLRNLKSQVFWILISFYNLDKKYIRERTFSFAPVEGD